MSETTGGISDKIQVLEETAYDDGGAAGEVVFGVTKTFTWQVDTTTGQSYGLETDGPQATVNTDGIMTVSGSHEWELTDGRELKAIMGSLPTNTGGAYVLDVAKCLPSYSVKAVDNAIDGKYVNITGLKYGQFQINMNTDEPITISADWTARNIVNVASFTPTVSTIEPLTYLDGKWTIGSTDQTGVESASVTINRNISPKRFMESTTSNEKRLITKIIEGPLNVTFEGSMEVKRSQLEEVWGSTALADQRTDKNFIFTASRGTETLILTLSGGRQMTVGRTLQKDQEVALAEFSGIALDIDGTGSYAV